MLGGEGERALRIGICDRTKYGPSLIMLPWCTQLRLVHMVTSHADGATMHGVHGTWGHQRSHAACEVGHVHATTHCTHELCS